MLRLEVSCVPSSVYVDLLVSLTSEHLKSLTLPLPLAATDHPDSKKTSKLIDTSSRYPKSYVVQSFALGHTAYVRTLAMHGDTILSAGIDYLLIID